MQDLAQYHEPISDFLAKDAGTADARPLTQEQVEFFQEHGYVGGIRLLDAQQVDWLRRELEELTRPDHSGAEFWYEYHTNESADPSKVLFHALGAWRIRPGFHDLLWHPTLIGAAEQLLQGPVRFWHDQLFCKPARHGGVVAWHQDYSYWTRTQPQAHLTCWIGLDASDRDNGCLQHIPGSHRWDLLPITGLAGDMDAIEEVLDEQQWAAMQQPALAELQPGECVFHHALTVHGSFANETDRPRRATVVNLFRDGVTSASNEPLLADIRIPAGQAMSGPYFPLLSDENREIR